MQQQQAADKHLPLSNNNLDEAAKLAILDAMPSPLERPAWMPPDIAAEAARRRAAAATPPMPGEEELMARLAALPRRAADIQAQAAVEGVASKQRTGSERTRKRRR